MLLRYVYLSNLFNFMQLLPSAWIENSIETYIYQHTTKSQVIYWVVLATIVLAFVLLPFVYVDISILSSVY